jgi:hypothetical protein
MEASTLSFRKIVSLPQLLSNYLKEWVMDGAGKISHCGRARGCSVASRADGHHAKPTTNALTD